MNVEALSHWGLLRPKQTNKQTAVLMKIRLPGFNVVSLGGQFPNFLPVVSKDPFALTFIVKQSKKNQLAYLHEAGPCSAVVQVVEKPAVSFEIHSYVTVCTRCCPSPRICVRYDSMLVFFFYDALLTLWRRNYFFLISAHTVYKM